MRCRMVLSVDKGQTDMSDLKALITVKDGDGSLFAADLIRHEGKLWIVPTWLENPTEGYKVPERIICLDMIRHQRWDAPPVSSVVNEQIPKAVMYGPGPLPPGNGYLVVLNPDIRVPIPRGIH